SGRIYDFDPGPLLLVRDDRVLVETERGPALGTVVVPAHLRPATRALQRVIKKADSRDLAREDQNLQRERQHYRTALELVRGRNLAIKLIKAESAFDASKVTFFFGGEERADLRDLGRELGELLRTRVESVKGDGTVVRQNVLKQTVVVRRSEDNVEVEAARDDLVVRRADG